MESGGADAPCRAGPVVPGTPVAQASVKVAVGEQVWVSAQSGFLWFKKAISAGFEVASML